MIFGKNNCEMAKRCIVIAYGCNKIQPKCVWLVSCFEYLSKHFISF